MTTAADRARDVWGGEPRPDGYDPSTFFLRASDGHGHGTQLSAKFPPDVVAQAAELVESGQYPYRTIADLLRDAAIHRMAVLSEGAEDADLQLVVGRFVERQVMEQALDDFMEEAAYADRLRAKLTAAYRIGMANEDYRATRLLLSEMRKGLVAMRGELARPIANLIDEYLTQIAERYAN